MNSMVLICRIRGHKEIHNMSCLYVTSDVYFQYSTSNILLYQFISNFENMPKWFIYLYSYLVLSPFLLSPGDDK